MTSIQEPMDLCTYPESRRSSVSLASVTTSTTSTTPTTPTASTTSTTSTASNKVTTELNPEMNHSAFVSQNPSHPLPAYARDFPKPAGDLDIDEALNRTPGRWTFRGTVERSLKSGPRPSAHEINKEGARSSACAEAKKSLLESAAQMNAAQSK